MNDAKERMGLRLVENTLRSDWDTTTGELADVQGAVRIDVLPGCVLQPDIIEEIAELLANEACHDFILESNVQIDSWKITRTGDSIEVAPATFSDTDFVAPRKSPSFNEHAGDVRPVNGWNS